MDQLKIIKPFETGKFGYLIEEDAGYISPDEKRNQQFIQEIKKLEKGTPIMAEPLIVYVVLQKYGVENRNGRIYPEAMLKRENERYQEVIRDGRAIGELDHPESSIINGDRISHNILETWWEGATLMGKMQIIMSPGFINYGFISCKGDLVANYMRNGIKIGVSSRGVGSLEEVHGKNIVQDDFELICWDIVTTPSTPGSWIFTNKEDSKPYVENFIRENNDKLIDGLDKFLLG